MLASLILTNSIFSRDYILKKAKIKTRQLLSSSEELVLPHASYGPALQGEKRFKKIYNHVNKPQL